MIYFLTDLFALNQYLVAAVVIQHIVTVISFLLGYRRSGRQFEDDEAYNLQQTQQRLNTAQGRRIFCFLTIWALLCATETVATISGCASVYSKYSLEQFDDGDSIHAMNE